MASLPALPRPVFAFPGRTALISGVSVHKAFTRRWSTPAERAATLTAMTVTDIPERVLMGPGPSDVSPRACWRRWRRRRWGTWIPNTCASWTRRARCCSRCSGRAITLTLAGAGHGQRGHGGVRRQPGRARRRGHRLRRRRVRRAHGRRGRAPRRDGRARRGPVGQDHRPGRGAGGAGRPPARQAGRHRPRRDVDRRAPAAGGDLARSCTRAGALLLVDAVTSLAGPSCASTTGASTRATAARRSACPARPGWRR